jgi:hypothetical protein
MTELDMTPPTEARDFTDDLGDEALDRAEGQLCACCNGNVEP